MSAAAPERSPPLRSARERKTPFRQPRVKGENDDLLRQIADGLKRLKVEVADLNQRMATPYTSKDATAVSPLTDNPYPYGGDLTPPGAETTRLGGVQDLHFMRVLRYGATAWQEIDNRYLATYSNATDVKEIPTFDGRQPERKMMDPLGDRPGEEATTAYRRYRLMQQFAALVAGVARCPIMQLMYSWTDIDAHTRQQHTSQQSNLFRGGFGDDDAVLWSVQPYMSAPFYAHFRLVLEQIRREANGARCQTMPLEQLVSTRGFAEQTATWVAGKMLALNTMSGHRYARAEAAEQLDIMVSTARRTLYSLR